LDIRKVKKLIELLEESGIAEIEIKEGEEAVRISRMPTGGYVTHMQAPMMQAPPVAALAAPVAPAPAAAATAADNSRPGRTARTGASADIGLDAVWPMVTQDPRGVVPFPAEGPEE